MTAKNKSCERCRQVRHVLRKCPCTCAAKCGHPGCDGKSSMVAARRDHGLCLPNSCASGDQANCPHNTI